MLPARRIASTGRQRFRVIVIVQINPRDPARRWPLARLLRKWRALRPLTGVS